MDKQKKEDMIIDHAVFKEWAIGKIAELEIEIERLTKKFERHLRNNSGGES